MLVHYSLTSCYAMSVAPACFGKRRAAVGFRTRPGHNRPTAYYLRRSYDAVVRRVSRPHQKWPPAILPHLPDKRSNGWKGRVPNLSTFELANAFREISIEHCSVSQYVQGQIAWRGISPCSSPPCSVVNGHSPPQKGPANPAAISDVVRLLFRLNPLAVARDRLAGLTPSRTHDKSVADVGTRGSR